MLKPFQIRDLHEAPSQSQGGASTSSAGTVQISSTDYDDIATNHPRARLTYLDDDDEDGDKITVTLHHIKTIIHDSVTDSYI